ncbi:MAG: hypothetical protein KGM24_08890, partial [Elusimicrobia bacterium]|nr:hypothetical protein [Elusimicrobiota bacterium]
RAAAPSPLEAAFAAARALARPAADPVAVLSGPASAAEKLSALDALQSRLPDLSRRRLDAALGAIAAAAAPGQDPAVRAKACAFLGYAIPVAAAGGASDAARSRALDVLLAALREPAYRIFVLRGLGPAAHGLSDADLAREQTALLDLLDGPAAGEERATALVALNAVLDDGGDLLRRRPDMAAQLDARLLSPVEADPAGFVADPRGTPQSRELQVAVLWLAARERESLGDDAPAARLKLLLGRLDALEPDAGVRRWIETYRDAAPPPPFKASTTRRGASAGRDAP